MHSLILALYLMLFNYLQKTGSLTGKGYKKQNCFIFLYYVFSNVFL
jgi:hypothetical protein